MGGTRELVISAVVSAALFRMVLQIPVSTIVDTVSTTVLKWDSLMFSTP